MEKRPEPQTEFCSQCGKEKPWIDIYEIDYQPVCVDCLPEPQADLDS